MKNHRLLLCAILATTLCGGCGTPEASAPVPAPATVSEIDAKIREAQANPNIPPQAKPKVLAALQKQRDEAAKTQPAAK